MRRKGMAVYATEKYARIKFDKYIQSNREYDETAKKLTNNKPSLIFLGAAELHSSRPIGTKNGKRCPGVRKLLISIKKLGHSVVIFVDEYFTSQTCARCFGRFPRNTRSHRFKVCRNCQPHPDARLPSKVVTEKSKRLLQSERKLLKRAAANGQVLFRHRVVQDAIVSIRGLKERLVSKVAFYRKNWHSNVPNHGLNNAAVPQQQQQQQPGTVVWQRDIVASSCIMYKGMYQ